MHLIIILQHVMILKQEIFEIFSTKKVLISFEYQVE